MATRSSRYRWRANLPLLSSFDATQGDALDEGLLCKEEEDQRRDGDQHRRGIEQLPLAAVVAQERVEAQGQGEFALVVEIDQRVEEVVPRADEVDQGHRGQSGFGEGQDDA